MNERRLQEFADLAARLAPAEQKSLGAPQAFFKTGLENVVAGYVLCVLFSGGGLVGLWFSVRELVRKKFQLPLFGAKDSWAMALFAILACVGIIALGMVIAWSVRRSTFTRIFVCSQGLLVRQGDVTFALKWDDIVHVEETLLHERSPILKPPANVLLPRSTSKSYSITRRGGAKLEVDGGVVRRVGRFGNLLRAACNHRRIPWDVVEQHG